jgi:hypothetical protein
LKGNHHGAALYSLPLNGLRLLSACAYANAAAALVAGFNELPGQVLAPNIQFGQRCGGVAA